MNARARQVTPEHSDEILDSGSTAPYRMSRSQLMITWGVVGLMLIAVFLFGFYSGRKQGVELALTEQSVPRLRLPVESPKARAALSAPPIVNEAITPPTTKFDFTDTKPDSFAVEAEEKNTETIVLEPKAENKSDPTAGFVGKAANEISIPPTENRDIPSTTPSEQSLAERVAKVELSPTLGARQGEPTKIEKSEAKIEVATVKETVKTPPVIAPKTLTPEAKITTTAKKATLEPVKTKTTPISGLYVQVGAPDSFSKAQSMVSKLKMRGITAAIRDASVNNKMHYRVLVGPFGSRDSAQSAKNQVIKSGVALGEPFIKNF